MRWRTITSDDAEEVRARLMRAMGWPFWRVQLSFSGSGGFVGFFAAGALAEADLASLEAAGLRRTDDGWQMREAPIDATAPVMPSSCGDAVEVCRGRVVAQVAGEDARDAKIAAVKASLVEAMRYDRADEVVELRAELATLRNEASAPVKVEE